MRRSSLAVLLSGFLLVTACTSAEDEPTPEPAPETSAEAPSPVGNTPDFTAPAIGGPTTFIDTNNGFEIDHPKNWKMHQEGQENCPTTYCWYAPAQNGQVPASIMVTVATNTGENLQISWNTVRQLLTSSWGVKPKTVPGTQGNTEMAGENAKTAEYTLDWGLIPAQMIQTMALAPDGTPMMVTGISAESIWGDVESTFADATASFAFS